MSQTTHLFGRELGAYAFENSGALSSSTGLTASNYEPIDAATKGKAQRVLITISGTAGTDNVRFRLDATAPTSTSGHLLLPGQSLLLETFQTIRDFRVIDGAGTGSRFAATYFR